MPYISKNGSLQNTLMWNFILECRTSWRGLFDPKETRLIVFSHVPPTCTWGSFADSKTIEKVGENPFYPIVVFSNAMVWRTWEWPVTSWKLHVVALLFARWPFAPPQCILKIKKSTSLSLCHKLLSSIQQYYKHKHLSHKPYHAHFINYCSALINELCTSSWLPWNSSF